LIKPADFRGLAGSLTLIKFGGQSTSKYLPVKRKADIL
jgi:hypothetical protein